MLLIQNHQLVKTMISRSLSWLSRSSTDLYKCRYFSDAIL